MTLPKPKKASGDRSDKTEGQAQVAGMSIIEDNRNRPRPRFFPVVVVSVWRIAEVRFTVVSQQSLLSSNDEKTEDEDELEDDYDFGTKGEPPTRFSRLVMSHPTD